MISHAFSPMLEQLVELALLEDLCAGDATTDCLFNGDEHNHARLISREPLVLAGAPVFEYVMHRVARLPGAAGPVQIEFVVPEGTHVESNTTLAKMSGPSATLLRGERIALNFLQRLSGIATQVRRFSEALGERPAITDTRKTTPGFRELERYAVRVGGGRNHRFNLGGGVMIKDNHIAAVGSITEALRRARKNAPHTLRIEVEVANLAQLDEALAAGADILMLDNMDTPTMQEAIRRAKGHALIEISGGITLDRIPELAALDVDIISSGALTHTVKAADISMLFEDAMSFK